MLSHDLDKQTVDCRNCGVVPITWKVIRGKKTPRCSIAIKEQKHNRGRHGLRDIDAKAMRLNSFCAICGSSDKLVVDHDHNTMKIRGVLCHYCNIGLGLFKDNPELLSTAIEYLKKS